MKIADLRKQSPKELTELLTKERESIATFNFQSAKGRASDVKSRRKSRRTIARILTLLKQTS